MLIKQFQPLLSDSTDAAKEKDKDKGGAAGKSI
jgi:hypothetical protein